VQSEVAFMVQLADMAQLVRLPLALMVTATALAGALAVPSASPRLTLWALAWGVFLLAAASSVLNQVQERGSDALMRRTCRRPLASNRLAATSGTRLGILLGSGGLAVLAAGTNPATTLLGLAALAWYLAVYTPLKRLCPLAVLAGTPCGAIPPLMGWLAAWGPFPAPQPLALALVMVLWQVPHYWLLALPDRAELTAAGFRTLPQLSECQLLAVSQRWILGLALCTLFLPALGLPAHPALQLAMASTALTLAVAAGWLIFRALFAQQAAARLRRILHLYLAAALLILLVDALWRG